MNTAKTHWCQDFGISETTGLQQNSTKRKGIYKTKQKNTENWAEDDVDKDDSSKSFVDTVNATFVVVEIPDCSLQWVNKKKKIRDFNSHHCLGDYHVYI